MTSISTETDLSPQGIIAAIESNLTDVSATLSRDDDAVVFRGSDVTWVYSGLPGLSRVMQARFPDADAQDRVEEVLSYFQTWNAPVTWVVGPSSYPTNLGDRLLAGGLGRADLWTGTARQLVPMMGRMPLPAGLRIQSDSKPETISAWLEVGQRAEKAPVDSNSEAAFSQAAGDSRCRVYVARHQDKPVARALSFQQGDVVGIYWLATIPEFRRRGFGSAMLHRVMEDARRRNAALAVLPVRGEGRSLSQRLGFRPYCQFTLYSWPAPAPLPC